MAKLDSGAMTIGNNDNWREIFDDQNATAQAANQATADLAPIINGKRCALSVASGGYVLLRNSTITGKADGAYTAAKAIPANTDLDGSYLTAISGGVANALNGKMTTRTALTCVVASGAPITIEKNNSYRFLGLAIINLRIRVTGSYSESQIIINGFPEQYGASLGTGSSAITMASNKKHFSMDEYGQIIAVESLSSSDGAITLSGVYVTSN